MKLRLRSFESKETLKMEVPNSCTLSQLKQTLAQALPNSPAFDSIRLSLNRKDDLVSDDDNSLRSLGIAAGDLIYFSLEQPAAGMSSNPQSFHPLLTGSMSSNTQNALPEVENSDFTISGADSKMKENVDCGSQMEVDMGMEVDEDDGCEDDYETDGFAVDEVVDKSFSVPGFLRKVFMEELGDDAGKDHKLIIIAIHAVMMETGFVGYGFHFRGNEWPSSLFRVSLHYTLQENPNLSPAKVAKSIVLKFQSLGKFINVYGTLEKCSGKSNRGTYRVQLNEEKLVPFLNVVWANISGEDVGKMDPSPEKEVFEFWRNVKDNLALPLLIDLCDELGLQLPPCFMQLPTDLKLKILESLPGVDIAKISCVCSEMRYLGSNDDLWKLKFVEVFGDEVKEAQGSWKKTFARFWAGQKSRKVGRARMTPFWPEPYWAQPRRRRYPNPFMVARAPRIIGGDYDISPSFELGHSGGRVFGAVNRRSSNFSPQCDLGVRGDRFV
ncbi:F-box protein SKIP22 [Striga hermonthica]|uniref:F-box protein SKIP22 n=1 Tax=Striga hermonthica TaxID=68872 RepID=A0A9N7MKZ4_STRHE|nr:F-box protein SKIP22 [Striga hermonthica]